MAALDDTRGCIKALTELNQSVAEMSPHYAAAAGELKRLQHEWKRRLDTAILTPQVAEGRNAAEREALAAEAVRRSQPDLESGIEDLIGTVETHRIRFALIERQSSNVQSILTSYRDEERMSRHVERGR